ncbi:DUF4197 domain-containing protein [Marinilabiliaceae bacterium ANBcel2]|nr:DUF4197 domain-containing protein [Marinilabiliaceae bacterium ANBcel2]
MIKKIFGVVSITLIVLASCDEYIEDIINYPSEYEISNGLKEALKNGTDVATNNLGVANGYYEDELVKIMLPDELQQISEYLDIMPFGENLMENLTLQINSAAEHSAKNAGPIFYEAISDLTIERGIGILNGENDAATKFLKENTFDELHALYKPEIESAMGMGITDGGSVNDTWNTLTTDYNSVANSLIGSTMGLDPIETDLSSYLTNQALNGLFIKIAEQESIIREDPAARTSDLLKKVFKYSGQ